MISVYMKGWWQGEYTGKNRPFPKGDQYTAPAGGRNAGTDKGLLPGGTNLDIECPGGKLPDGKRDKSASGGRADSGRKAAQGYIRSSRPCQSLWFYVFCVSEPPHWWVHGAQDAWAVLSEYRTGICGTLPRYADDYYRFTLPGDCAGENRRGDGAAVWVGTEGAGRISSCGICGPAP